MSITGERDDLPGGGPQKAGVAVTDIVTGMYATVAILAALQERQRSGLGQHLDIALLDSHVALLANQNSNYFHSGVAPRRAGNAHQNVVPYQVFAARDGHLIVATGNESQYRAYCAAIGAPELGDDPRFATNRLRIRNRDELVGLLSAIMLQAGATTDRQAGSGGRALRSDQRHRPGLRASAGGGSAAAPRPAASGGRRRGGHRQPAALLRHAGGLPPRAAAAGPAHRGSAARGAGQVRG